MGKSRSIGSCFNWVVLFIVLIFLRKAKKAANEAVELNKRLAEKQRDLEKALVQAESANEAKTTSLSFQAEADGLTITGEHDDYRRKCLE